MALPALLADYLFLAPLLRARLAERINLPCETVETTEQVLAADRRQQVLYVLWAGDALGDRAAQGRAQLMVQRWGVILALNNVGAAADARHVAAGPVLSLIHQAVVGWTPAGAARPFTRAEAPLRPVIHKTKALYPLGFEIELSL